MGSEMIKNMVKDGRDIYAYDKSATAVDNLKRKLVDLDGMKGNLTKASLEDIGKSCSVVVSMLPNDTILKAVTAELLESAKVTKNSFTHVSCSTVSPVTSRALSEVHKENGGNTLIAAPVFARPDGLARREATWMLGGVKEGRDIAAELLVTSGNIVDMGDDQGAANIVKLCGNFLIASSIEAISESMALAEKHGVERTQVMNILSSTIFDCLIYKGYGNRVAHRDHRPGGFSLELGLKDVSLVSQAAREGNVPMPFLSTLLDRYVSAKARGRADFDWSAIGLSVAEDAGIDVSADERRNRKDIDEGNTY